jgi:hypothetical protein
MTRSLLFCASDDATGATKLSEEFLWALALKIAGKYAWCV